MIELLSARGRTLSYISHNPTCTVKEMTEGLFLSRRAVALHVDELMPLLDVAKDGREYRYVVRATWLTNVLLELGKWNKE